MIFILCLLQVWLVVAKDDKGGWEESVNEEGKKVQTLKIEAPSMTEEDQYGYNMPDRYKCDSCRAIVHHLQEALNKQQPKSRRLKSWEYTDLFEETCRSAFEGYGIKLVNGENVLSGPGLKDNVELQPGMGAIQMGGENWKKRLAEECRKLIFEHVGEDDFYGTLYGKWKAGDALDPREYCIKEAEYCKAQKLGPSEPPKEEKKVKNGKGKADKADKQSQEPPKEEKKPKKGKGKSDKSQELWGWAKHRVSARVSFNKKPKPPSGGANACVWKIELTSFETCVCDCVYDLTEISHRSVFDSPRWWGGQWQLSHPDLWDDEKVPILPLKDETDEATWTLQILCKKHRETQI